MAKLGFVSKGLSGLSEGAGKAVDGIKTFLTGGEAVKQQKAVVDATGQQIGALSKSISEIGSKGTSMTAKDAGTLEKLSDLTTRLTKQQEQNVKVLSELKSTAPINKAVSGTASALKSAATSKTTIALGGLTGALVVAKATGILDSVTQALGGGGNDSLSVGDSDNPYLPSGDQIGKTTANQTYSDDLGYLQAQIDEIVDFLKYMYGSGSQHSDEVFDPFAESDNPYVSDTAKTIQNSGLSLPILLGLGALTVGGGYYILKKSKKLGKAVKKVR